MWMGSIELLENWSQENQKYNLHSRVEEEERERGASAKPDNK